MIDAESCIKDVVEQIKKSIEIKHNGQMLRGMEHIPEGGKAPAVILYHGFTGTKLEPHRFF
jgi:fermentation-respiration switch protein FrsA (DUF1100 family)